MILMARMIAMMVMVRLDVARCGNERGNVHCSRTESDVQTTVCGHRHETDGNDPAQQQRWQNQGERNELHP